MAGGTPLPERGIEPHAGRRILSAYRRRARKARTSGGDQPLDGRDVLAAVAPVMPNLLVAGTRDVVARLRDAPDGSAVHVEGLVNLGSRTYELRRVDAENTPSER